MAEPSPDELQSPTSLSSSSSTVVTCLSTKLPPLVDNKAAEDDDQNFQGSSFPSSPPLSDSKHTPRRIYWIRHGETDWNVEGKIQGGGYDIPLNENGKRQAQLVAAALSDLPISVVVSSTMARAQQTADILQKELLRHSSSKAILRFSYPGFNEMSFGQYEGLAWQSPTVDDSIRKEFKALYKQMCQRDTIAFPGPGGESTKQVVERTLDAMQQLWKDLDHQHSSATEANHQHHPHEHQHIAIVAHGRTNKIILAQLLHQNALEFCHIPQSSK